MVRQDASPQTQLTLRELRKLKKMTVVAGDYGTLLAETQPSVVHGEQENERFTNLLEQLAFKSQPNSAERKLVELLSLVIQDFEGQRYQIDDATPIQVLTELMSERGLKQKDLVDDGI